jgi:hypothetical protein
LRQDHDTGSAPSRQGGTPARRVSVAILFAALAACAPTRIEQVFTPAPGKTDQQLAEDRYDCIQRHDRLSNFIACMEARGHKHVK